MKPFFPIVTITVSTLIMLGCSDEKSPAESQKEHFEADGWVILDEEFHEVYHVWRGESEDTLRIHAGCESEHWQIRFFDRDSNLIDPPEDEDHVLGWEFKDENLAEIERHDGDIWEFHFVGVKEGETTLKLMVMHGDHSDMSTPSIPVIIEEAVDECPTEHDHEHE